MTKITIDQFEVLAKLTRAREPAKTAVRMVLIDARVPADVARDLDMSPQSVSNAVSRYRKADKDVVTAYKGRIK